jgi:hypothetical protein
MQSDDGTRTGGTLRASRASAVASAGPLGPTSLAESVAASFVLVGPESAGTLESAAASPEPVAASGAPPSVLARVSSSDEIRTHVASTKFRHTVGSAEQSATQTPVGGPPPKK